MSYTDRGFRNVIRNGDMSITQRGYSSVVNPQNYYIDGWYCRSLGGSQQVIGDKLSTSETSNRVQINTTGQSTVSDYSYMRAYVEDCRTLAGEQVTLSFTAYSSTSGAKVWVDFMQHFGTGGSPSTNQGLSGSSVTLTGASVRYSVTVNLPSVSGKVLGTSGTDHLYVTFFFSAGSNWSPINIGVQNHMVTITEVQLEAGSVATPFEKIPQSMQWDWNRRYFQRWYQPPLCGAVSTATLLGRMGMPLSTVMRAVPTATLTGALPVWDQNAVSTVSSLGTAYLTPQSMEFDFSAVGGMTAYRPARVYQNSPTTNYIDLSAELL